VAFVPIWNVGVGDQERSVSSKQHIVHYKRVQYLRGVFLLLHKFSRAVLFLGYGIDKIEKVCINEEVTCFVLAVVASKHRHTYQRVG